MNRIFLKIINALRLAKKKNTETNQNFFNNIKLLI